MPSLPTPVPLWCAQGQIRLLLHIILRNVKGTAQYMYTPQVLVATVCDPIPNHNWVLRAVALMTLSGTAVHSYSSLFHCSSRRLLKHLMCILYVYMYVHIYIYIQGVSRL